jgi:hypothetical protein
MDAQFNEQVALLYRTYNEVIKPLIAEIEVRYEKFPTPIFNEIRAFNDHVARCFRENISDLDIENELRKANGHIERIILDCYKFLNVALHKNVIKQFDKRTKGIDLGAINNGTFVTSYSETKRLINTHLKEAKLLEVQDKEESLKKYEFVYNKFSELEIFLNDNEQHICWARAKYYSSKITKLVGWLLAAIISGIISSIYIPWDRLFSFFH